MTGDTTFQPPLAATPSLGFNPPLAISTAGASSPYSASAMVTQYALATAGGLGKNRMEIITWAEWERRGGIIRRTIETNRVRMTAFRGY